MPDVKRLGKIRFLCFINHKIKFNRYKENKDIIPENLISIVRCFLLKYQFATDYLHTTLDITFFCSIDFYSDTMHCVVYSLAIHKSSLIFQCLIMKNNLTD